MGYRHRMSTVVDTSALRVKYYDYFCRQCFHGCFPQLTWISEAYGVLSIFKAVGLVVGARLFPLTLYFCALMAAGVLTP